MKANNQQTKPKFVHNAKVIYIEGKKQTDVMEMHDKAWALCKWWCNQHKDDIRYRGGKLVTISMLAKGYKIPEPKVKKKNEQLTLKI